MCLYRWCTSELSVTPRTKGAGGCEAALARSDARPSARRPPPGLRRRAKDRATPFRDHAGVSAFGAALAAGRSVVSARGYRGLWAGVGFKSLHLGCGGALMAVLQPACEKAWAKARA